MGYVGDGGRGAIEIGPLRAPGDGGIGLRLVDRLASRWGTELPSSDVWFELAPPTRRGV